MPKPILHTALFHLPHQLSIMLAHADGNIHMAGAHHGGKFLINFYSRLALFRLLLANLSVRLKIAVALGIVFIPAATLLTLFLLPKQVSYSYSGSNCFSNIVVLPGFVSAHSATNFSVKMQPNLTLGGYPLLSTQTCSELLNRPSDNLDQTVTLQAGLFKKSIHIASNSLPSIQLATNLSEPVSPFDDIAFNLSEKDETFNYSIKSGESSHDCNVESLSVNCPLADFNFVQGQSHNFSVLQYFGGDGEEVYNGNITLRDPVTIVSTSITEDQIVYEAPDRISISTNKPLDSVADVELIADTAKLGIKTAITENGFDVIFDEPLPRQAELALTIGRITAIDGAYLPQAYTLRFSTSGGPKVIGVNISGYNVSPGKTIVISFDSAISTSQNISEFVKLTVANEIIQTQTYISGSRVSITLGLPACTPFTVQVLDGLSNSSGITGGSSWSLNSRTTCGSTFSIGSSVQGRSLVAHRFGSGSTTILFVGGMHGNERSSYYTLKAWVDELEQKYDQIPADKTIIVIPDINPDGFAARTRTNANNVDLNRNFPSNDWASGIYMPGNIYLEFGGGNNPLDQPESATLASFISQYNPRLVLTYHAVAKAVIANGAGDSVALSKIYADASGYAHYDSGHEDSLFNYATTGEFETWLADKKGISTLLVELATLGSNEMYSQRSAMWAMLRI